MKALTVNVFFRCNAKCVFCVVGLSGGDRTAGEFSVDEVKDALRRGFESGCRSVTFSGGEPTVYSGLGEVVRYARELGYKGVEIKTNGIRLVHKELARELVEAGVDLFSISIHGPEAEIHDRLVGVPRAFERAVAGASLVKQLGAELSLPTCIQRGNYERLPDTVGLLMSLRPKYLLPTFVEPSGSAAFRFDEVVPWYSEVVPYLQQVCRRLDAEADFAWAVHGFPMCVLEGYESHSYDLVRNQESVGGSDTEDYFEFEQRHLRVKAEKCRDCLFNTVCGGPWREYVARRGWEEFTPIEDRSPFEVIPLQLLAKALFTHGGGEPQNAGERQRC